MKYVSTRGGVKPIEFSEAVMMGLADDGGLIVPESIPDVAGSIDAWSSLPYDELAFEILRLFAADIPAGDLKALVSKTYGEAFGGQVAPVVRVGPVHLIELFHGPTLAFKDVALQLLGNIFEYILAGTGGRLNILGATSGDTGSAAIYGVRGRSGIDIFMMHPHNRISAIQHRQMTSVLDDNVHNIAVEGSFDDCQRIMKELASDIEFKRRYSLGAVNSVNWARIAAQIVYYFAAVLQVRLDSGADAVNVAVPTGNFGDILAGWYAKQMGLPIGRLVLATNENDILSRFFNTGEYSLGEVHHTLSPAMDIQVASNFERYLYYRVNCDSGRLCGLMDQFARDGSLRIAPDAGGVVDADFVAAMATDGQVLDTIREYHKDYGYLLDPHSAVGVSVAHRPGADAGPMICLATAHPAKFPEAISEATGEDLAHHPDIDALADKPTRCEVLPNDTEVVRGFITKTIG